MADDTLAKLFWSRVDKSADKPAQMFKQGGTWKTLTWREVGEAVREVALGLITLGRSKGDTIALLSSSRAEWVQADFAIFSVGGITVPVYPSYPPDLIATSSTTPARAPSSWRTPPSWPRCWRSARRCQPSSTSSS